MRTAGSWIIGAALLTVGPGSVPIRSQAAPESRPNVVFILADDLGWSDTTLTARPVLRTPNIDAAGRPGHAVHAGVRGQSALLADAVGHPDRAEPARGPASPRRTAICRRSSSETPPGRAAPTSKCLRPRASPD